ncbi:MAG: flavodoxin family protein [Lentisphaerae bacterium]|jgi:multimeric flavodoxin WrbA|nr:flavodoxin family protein [Lentisphaerota bacterium]MBT4814279.1 flavodoxin family protein [Lentisphaerota bacterium]MBT5611141.1 flavodoxin family protein [Lentisphaerota bacterium]MBT7059831.1 flavodoxin family protein [Lentisphaerota bacterium]MBT7844034.1 flavodoxin family protein [Lentisphaerota bacterium]
MYILAILGSRNPDGQTARATDALLKGAASKGATSDKIFLPACQLERCRQCEDNGWGLCRTEGRCVIDDDFAAITEKLRAADLVVFANPVYFCGLSESLHAYLNRLGRIGWIRENARPGIQNKPVVGIAVAGGGGAGSYECVRRMRMIFGTCRFDVVDIVPARRQNLDAKCRALEATGEWLMDRG